MNHLGRPSKNVRWMLSDSATSSGCSEYRTLYALHVIIIINLPDGTVVDSCDEQVKSAGSGIQLPLLWHVTLRVCSSIEVSQVNIKIEPSRVEL